MLCKKRVCYGPGDGTESQYMAALEVETSLAEGELEGLGLGRYNEFSLVELTYVALYLFVALGDISG